MISINKNILNIKNPNSGEYEQVAALQGKSAYEIAVDNGFEGSEQDYLDHVASINRSAEEFRNNVTELSNRIADRFEEMESVHNQLSSEIDDFKLIELKWNQGAYSGIAGNQIGFSPSSKTRVNSGLVKLSKGSHVLTKEVPENVYVALTTVDLSGVIIKEGTWGNSLEYVADSDIQVIVIGKKKDNSNITPNEVGEVFIENKKYAEFNKLTNRVYDLKDEIDDFKEPTKNLIDIEDWLFDKTYVYNTGSVVSRVGNAICTVYIPITSSLPVTITVYDLNDDETITFRAISYNEDKQHTGNWGGKVVSKNKNYYTFTTSDVNDKYIRIYTDNGNLIPLHKILVEVGNKSTDYVPKYAPILYSKIDERLTNLENTNDNKYEIPTYLLSEYKTTLDTIMAKKKSDSIVFGIMTDLHFSSKDGTYNSWLRTGVFNALKSLSNMSYDVKFDIIGLLGDYEQFPTKADGQVKQMGIENLIELNEYIDKMKGKTAILEGNHELKYLGGGDTYGMSDNEFYKYSFERLVYRHGYQTNGIHAFYDDISKMVRYVFLNTTTTNTQDSVKDYLREISNTSYDIVILNHFSGETGDLYQSTKDYIDTIKTNGGNIILWLGGHSHQDWHYEYNGCLIVSFIQSGYWTSDISENGITYNHSQGNVNESAFTVILLNRTDKKVECIRFGLGIDYTYNLLDN